MAGAKRSLSRPRAHASATSRSVDLDEAVREHGECARFEVALDRAPPPERSHPWVFPSDIGKAGYIEGIQHLNARIGAASGTQFWFHALCNCFITVAGRELMLPTSLTKSLVNHARPQDVTERYAADWTMAQLCESVQRVADRIDALIRATMSTPETSRSTGCPAPDGEIQSQPMGPSGRACGIRRQRTLGAGCLFRALDPGHGVR